VNAAAKLGAYGLVLGVALAGSAAIGSVSTAGAEADHQGHTTTTRAAESRGDTPPEEKIPGGVLVSQAGYTIQTDDRLVSNAGAEDESFQFQVTGRDGAVVRDFEVRHERELHLIVAARDLGSFAHLHPSRAPDGTWTVTMPPLAPGSYRAVFDFVPAGGPELKLGVDLAVPGWFDPRPLPPPAATSSVDGYEVSLSGAPAAGSSSEVALTVTRNGQPVKDLEPYLGAFGHLVALRAGDLAYLHVHPIDGTDGPAGPTVRFAVEVPSRGEYRLFFDFAHRGKVHTAAFTVHVPAAGSPGTEPSGGHGAGAHPTAKAAGSSSVASPPASPR
jgi:hypothetical protein